MNVIELFRKICLNIVWVMISATGLMAQTVPPSLNKQVHVAAKQVNIIALGDTITAQTGLILSFNAQKIIAQKQLWLPHPSYSIHQLLTMIQKATGSEYTIYKEHIIFHRKPRHPAVTQTAAINQTEKRFGSLHANIQSHIQVGSKLPGTTVNKLSRIGAQHHTPAQPAPTSTKKPITVGRYIGKKETTRTVKSSNDSSNIYRDITTTDHSNTDTGPVTKVLSGDKDDAFVNISDDNTTAGKQQPYLLNYLTSPAITMMSIKPANPTLLMVHPVTQQQKQRRQYERPGFFKPFVSTGFGADEVLYANFQARAGVTLLYGIATWSTNFSVSGFRYGAGSSYPLKNGWLIQLEATTGKFSKVTPVSLQDTATIKYPLTTNSRLQRISLFAQKSITSNCSVYAGPVFNHLKSTYLTIFGQVSPTIISQRTYATEKEYTIIRPPYTLTSSSPEELDDVKTWIGLQVGINYRF